MNIEVTDYDVIIGYRADDSYFRIADGFLGNQITYEVLKEALHLGTLGKQFVLTSDYYEEYKNNYIPCSKLIDLITVKAISYDA